MWQESQVFMLVLPSGGFERTDFFKSAQLKVSFHSFALHLIDMVD
jgi:hypothetical protein